MKKLEQEIKKEEERLKQELEREKVIGFQSIFILSAIVKATAGGKAEAGNIIDYLFIFGRKKLVLRRMNGMVFWSLKIRKY